MNLSKLKQVVVAGIAVLATAAMSACASSAASVDPKATAETVRIGYFANLTHAPALVARQQQLFEKYLGETKVEFTVFSAGPAAIEAFKGGALDLAYIGPNPAIAGYVTTNGSLLNVVSGATSGGAKFVVKPELIASEGQPTEAEIAALNGKIIADPQLGGTQDVALRTFLTENNLTVDGGSPDVAITPLANADTLAQFKLGAIDGAWVPEPWATRLILEGGAKVFIDEKDLWEDGKFVTTNIVASQKFLNNYPATVLAVLRANLEAVEFLNDSANLAAAKQLVQSELVAQTGKALPAEVIDAAWLNLQFTVDPLATTLQENFSDALALNQIRADATALRGIYELTPLNALLTELGKSIFEVPADLRK